MLDSKISTIYGDSITLPRALQILKRLEKKGFASCNLVLGIGSYTYNMLSRDTFGWAMTAIYAEVGNDKIDIYKDPSTDDGTKKSAKGLLRVEEQDGRYVLFEQQTAEQFEGGVLRTVFKDGALLYRTTLSEIRARLKTSWACPQPGAIEWD